MLVTATTTTLRKKVGTPAMESVKQDYTSSRPGIFVLLLFVVSIFYNGPGANLHVFTTVWGILVLWIVLAVIKSNLTLVAKTFRWLLVVTAVYIAWLAIAPIFSTYPYASSVQAAELMTLPLVIFAWALEARQHGSTNWQLTSRLLLPAGLALAIWGIFDFLLLRERSHGPLIDPNVYGALINLFLIPLAWNYLRTPRDAPGWESSRLKLAATGILALALFMTLSRGALIAFLAVTPLLIWLNRKDDLSGQRTAYLVFVLAICYLFVKLGPIDTQSLSGLGIEQFLLNPSAYMEQASSLQARFLLWKSTARMVQDSNLFVGSGLGTFKTLYPPYRLPGEHSLGNYVHNDYLQALQEGGLIQLVFLVVFAVLIPGWLLYKNRAEDDNNFRQAPGLLLAILSVSLHAVVNFIHFMVPVAILVGLYLSVCFRSTAVAADSWSISKLLPNIRTSILKLVLVVSLLLQTTIVMLDGFIFRTFGSMDSIITDDAHRMTVLNAMLSFRSENPSPHLILILHLIETALQTDSLQDRHNALNQAEAETKVLAQIAPGHPLVPLLYGKISASRGSRNDLLIARDYFELAVKRTPHSTAMRTELIRTLRKLRDDKAAYDVVVAAVPWLPNETSLQSLYHFTKEAEALARVLEKPEEARYWESLQSQISILAAKG